MYVDKKLGGVHAVQTLHRLDRSATGKLETVVLDFVNETDNIQKSFQPYFQSTLLEEGTDQNKLYDYQNELDQFEIFVEADIDDFAAIFFNPKAKQEKLQPILDKVVNVWMGKQENEKEDFRSILQKYVRLYGFISQLITFEDVDLEKLYVFGKFLLRKLPKYKGQLPYDVQDAVDLDSFRIQQTYKGSIELENSDGTVKGSKDGTSKGTEDEDDLLSNIIDTLNETYGTDLTEDDKVDVEKIVQKYSENEEFKLVVQGNNTIENKRYKSDQIIDELLLDFVNTKLGLYKKLTDDIPNAILKQKLFEGVMAGG